MPVFAQPKERLGDRVPSWPALRNWLLFELALGRPKAIVVAYNRCATSTDEGRLSSTHVGKLEVSLEEIVRSWYPPNICVGLRLHRFGIPRRPARPGCSIRAGEIPRHRDVLAKNLCIPSRVCMLAVVAADREVARVMYIAQRTVGYVGHKLVLRALLGCGFGGLFSLDFRFATRCAVPNWARLPNAALSAR